MSLIAAFDPGFRNFGYAVIDPLRMKVIRNGMNEKTMTLLTTGKTAEVMEFKKFIRGLLNEGCKSLVAERFQSRGLMGLSVELVSFMLGIADGMFPLSRYIIASQWKTAYGRVGIDLKELYRDLRPITPHQIDASLIGLWMACKLRSLPLPTLSYLTKQITESAILPEKKVRKTKKPKAAKKAAKPKVVNNKRKGKT